MAYTEFYVTNGCSSGGPNNVGGPRFWRFAFIRRMGDRIASLYHRICRKPCGEWTDISGRKRFIY